MIHVSNNSLSTVFVSTLILFLPAGIFLWIAVFGHIAVLLKALFFVLFLATMVANYWINFLIYNIYYDPELKQIIIKQLGKIVYKSSSRDFEIKSLGIYAMSMANYRFVIDGRKFRFRSQITQFGFFEWFDKKSSN